MNLIPQPIIKYILEHITYPCGIIGCRASNSEMSFECCEYDLAIFCDKNSEKTNKFLRINDHTIELIHFPPINPHSYLQIKDMVLLKDYDNLILSSRTADFHNKKKYERLLQIFGRKTIINSLFCYDMIASNLYKRPILSSMWLKVAAYYFLEGVLALYDIKSSPLHELKQIRNLVIEREGIAIGINTALECIGIERATRSAVSRSLNTIIGLSQESYYTEALAEKANYLLVNNMVTDCYHYLGKIALKSIFSHETGKKISDTYMKSIQIMLDLNTDPQQIDKLHIQLLKACKDALRN